MARTAEEAVTEEKLRSVALSWPECHRIVERLGRPPNDVELGMFGALWSEHCGYKHSKALLRRLPTESPRFLVTAGEENAGAVDIGDGLAIVFNIIKKHGGEINAQSEEGRGTTITVTLPLMKESREF